MSDQHEKSLKIILVGNPNVGKSVLFNMLTGAYTTVSNYPGTSVEVSRGSCEIGGERYEVLDTPGMYSLLPITEEERVARQILLQEDPHTLVHVIDARNIERMLPMTVQLIEAGLPVILVVNILDEAERLGMHIDLERLQKNLGIPVIGAVMRQKVGLSELKREIGAVTKRKAGNRPLEDSADAVPRIFASPLTYAADLERDIDRIAKLIQGDYRLSRRATALLLLQRDEDVRQLVAEKEDEHHREFLTSMVNEISFKRRADLHLQLSLERRKLCGQMLEGVITQEDKGELFSEKLSNWMVNPWTGTPILLLVIYFGLYKFVGGFGAGTLVDLIEGKLFEGYINPPVIALAEKYLTADWLFELTAGEYGLWTLGVRYAVALVLPIVGSYFLVFSLLEDSGYLPRLALLVDRLFKKIGLSGRAVIPMILGFGCGTMATLVTRTLETKRERIIATLLLALAIPCSAQFGVILGLLSVSSTALAVWALVLMLVFLLVGLVSSRLMPGEGPVFYMEIPPLRPPQLRNVLVKTMARMSSYFCEILPLFLFASVLLWAGKMSGVLEGLLRGLQPVVSALGLPVEATPAFVFGFFRRDFGAAGLYDLQMDGFLSLAQLTVAAVTLTLFVPCVAQFLVMVKERGLRVALAILVFVTIVAFSTGWLLNRALIFSGLLS
jgi:ferrous iron transport protein B